MQCMAVGYSPLHYLLLVLFILYNILMHTIYFNNLHSTIISSITKFYYNYSNSAYSNTIIVVNVHMHIYMHILSL